jgi:hypothetical protein
MFPGMDDVDVFAVGTKIENSSSKLSSSSSSSSLSTGFVRRSGETVASSAH